MMGALGIFAGKEQLNGLEGLLSLRETHRENSTGISSL